MPKELTQAEGRAKFLADLHEDIQDKEALLRDPEGRIKALTERCKAAYEKGLIDDGDQCEYLEWIDSGFSWAEEELESRRLNPQQETP